MLSKCNKIHKVIELRRTELIFRSEMPIFAKRHRFVSFLKPKIALNFGSSSGNFQKMTKFDLWWPHDHNFNVREKWREIFLNAPSIKSNQRLLRWLLFGPWPRQLLALTHGQLQDKPPRHGKHTISDVAENWCGGLSSALISIFELLITSLTGSPDRG